MSFHHVKGSVQRSVKHLKFSSAVKWLSLEVFIKWKNISIIVDKLCN